MKKFYSKIDSADLIATVINSAATQRQDAAGTDEILQAAVIPLEPGRCIKNHRHKKIVRNTLGTAEAWVVMSGRLSAQLFDTDDTLLDTVELITGDCMILYRGGHSFTTIEPSVIFEIKNGPYFGSDQDMVRI